MGVGVYNQFTIPPKEAYYYELCFLPNAEEKYEVIRSQMTYLNFIYYHITKTFDVNLL